MGRRSQLTLAALLVAAIAPGCRDGTSSSEGFVVTGRIQNNTQAPIPLGTRLLTVWGVSSGTPDYGYVFGEGTINRLAGTFRIRFDQPPPLEALNAGVLGVGFIIATTDQSLKDGAVITAASQVTEAIGVTAQHAVIFVQDPEAAVQVRGWAAEFETGYGVGVGVKVPGDFDRFEPADRSSLVLIIDDPENIEVVNWT